MEVPFDDDVMVVQQRFANEHVRRYSSRHILNISNQNKRLLLFLVYLMLMHTSAFG